MMHLKIQLTPSQLSLWMGQKMNPASPLYNTASSYEIFGVLDEPRFRKAFQSLIDATDALRIRFTEEAGIPYQYVQPKLPYELEVVDFSNNTSDISIPEWLEDRSRRLFDLTREVFDSVLIKIGPERYLWYLNIHHLVTDGVSRKIVFHRMAQLYGGLKQGGDAPEHQGASFFEYVGSRLEDRNGDENAYWKERIQDIQEVPVLYGVRHIDKTTRARRLILNLGQKRSQKLRELAADPDLRSWTENLSLFNILASLLFIYLYRVSGQENLAIGAPTHNRVSRKFQETAGYFLEIFPLITSISPDDTFLTVIQRVKLEVNDHIRHSQQHSISAELTSTFNVVLNFINTSFSDFCGYKTTSSWIFPGHMDPSHQIRCHVSDFNGSGELTLFFDLNHGTFDTKNCENVPRHFLKLMDAMLSGIHTPVGYPEMLAEEEKRGIMGKSEDIPVNQSFLELYSQNFAKNSGSTALHYGDTELTYSGLHKKVGQVSTYLKQQGIQAGDSIGLYFYRSPEYIIGMLAAIRLGCTFVPIASDQPKARIAYILENSGCSFVLSDSVLIQNLPHTDIRSLELNMESIQLPEPDEADDAVMTESKDTAYILYTSGSTGNPKGVAVSYGALSNYLQWAAGYYNKEGSFSFPFFTSIGFDLTLTSLFLPLLTGGKIVIYREGTTGPDISLVQVLTDNQVNTIKITPSHIALIQGRDLSNSQLRSVIVGGEDFKTSAARELVSALGENVHIYNEYGPTEATVGSIVCEYDPGKHTETSVPIGKPITNMYVYLLDSYNNMVPNGVTGEVYLGGHGLAKGYLKMDSVTEAQFVDDVLVPGRKMYRTGDLARCNKEGDLEYLGRVDEQVKLNGFRIELQDIEANLAAHPAVETSAVVLINEKISIPDNEVINCTECGLPSNFPNTDFDSRGVCHLCNAFKGYKEKTAKYFKTEEDLKQLLNSRKGTGRDYDCISLLSGGKDSTYILARLINMDLRVLAFTLDNGYISDQAKSNIANVVKALGVDHVYGETRHMNKIFVDSLHRHSNVCNGCFKTIYTLSAQLALEKNIPFVVTGLSRGQFFETRLTEELFWDEGADSDTIDNTILEARKLYHKEEDAVKQLLSVDIFNDESTFEKVQFVDFFRYSDISLGEMLEYLRERVGWVRPTDTGRSTNCLINQLGIYVHKKEKGYSNYSFPYSWDVRLGHKTRDETLEEINEYIDEAEVKRIMTEIGYVEPNPDGGKRQRLVGYYTGNKKLPSAALKTHLSGKVPEYMIPSAFKYMEKLPLTGNGKVDKAALRSLNDVQLEMDTTYEAPRNEIEALVEKVWKEVLLLEKIGIHDNFIALGGHSLAAIRVTARLNAELELKLPLNKVFDLPTITEYARYIESTIMELLK